MKNLCPPTLLKHNAKEKAIEDKEEK